MIRVRQIKVNILKDTKEELLSKISKKLDIKKDEIMSYKINKKSIDARDKNNIFYVYEIDLDIKNENDVRFGIDVFKQEKEEYTYKITGKEKMIQRPIIVGSGPSGLFCGYMLCVCGYNPIIIERGEKIEDRIKTVEKFINTGKLNKDSNVQFGEGGAGTFSDGKLNTLVKDKDYKMKKVFEIFVENGAPEEILYENKPHIGTDKLRKVIINMRNKMISLGCEFKFGKTLTDIIIENDTVKKIIVNNNEVIDCDNLILALGHSARDTFKMLNKKGINMMSKPFAV